MKEAAIAAAAASEPALCPSSEELRMVRAIALLALQEAARHGEYRATFTPDGPGLHSIRVDAVSRSGGSASDSTYVRVADLNDEFVDAEMRSGLLKRIAEETGGRFYTPRTTGSLAADVALSKRGVTVVNEMDLWDMPVNFLLLVLLLSAEWGYRKYRALA